MHFDTDGVYTLLYTAEDSCGNETVEERTVIVASPRTVVYTDGTLIINEQPKDRANNIALHGEATATFPLFDPNGDTARKRYDFRDSSSYWSSTNVTAVEIGEVIQPEYINSWFGHNGILVSADLTNLDTTKVKEATAMFLSCSALTSITLGDYEAPLLTNTRQMFYGCTSLTGINLSNLDVSHVVDMGRMFNNCSSLTSLDLSNFDTSSAEDMEYLFNGCAALTSLDVSNFDTSNVTDMQYMFGNRIGVATLDLSSFNTSNVTNMLGMFYNAKNMTTIWVSSLFDVSAVTTSTSMFGGMTTKMTGGAGTKWAFANPSDKTYAHIDGGTADPGYFTAKA